MKKSFIFTAMVLALIFSMGLFGCDESDADRVATKINSVYETVRAVITDKDVIKEIPSDTLEKLAGLESQYLDARAAYKSSMAAQSGGDWSILKTMVSYGDGLVSILEDLPGLAKYQDEISIARVTVKALVAIFN